MCLDEIAKKDGYWREAALKICGDKNVADDVVQEMYLRKYRNDKGKEWNDSYVLATLKSVYMNGVLSQKYYPKEEIYLGTTDETFEPDDQQQKLLDKVAGLPFAQRELLELTYDYSLREIEKRFGVSYIYAFRQAKKARQTVLNGDFSKYINKRQKNMKDDSYYQKLDKRSKEYKTWKAGQSVGLGDVIEKVTKATGIDKVVKKLVGDDCGCDERKEKLNAFFNFKEKISCMDPSQIDDYADFVKSRKFKLLGGGRATGKLSPQEVTFVCAIFSTTFNRVLWAPECSTCAGSVKQLIAMIYKLDTLYLNSI